MTHDCIFIETESGIEVKVSTPFTWGSDVPLFHVAEYPSGRKYTLTQRQLELHFKIKTPQTVSFSSFAGFDRPTPEQAELEDDDGHRNPRL